MRHSVGQSLCFVCLLCVLVWWNFDGLDSQTRLFDHTFQGFDQSSVQNRGVDSEFSKSQASQSIQYFDVPNSQISAHASSIVDISNKLDGMYSHMLLYFAGSREGARDVGIYQSFFTPDKNSIQAHRDISTPTQNQIQDNQYNAGGFWSEPRVILDSPTLSQMSGKFIKKLGNPVSFVDSQGRVHLFVVGVSMGGWATSRIYWLTFDSELRTLNFIKELHLSPFFNLSFLVRAPAVLYKDGGFALPVYHEFLRKYPILLEFDSSLELVSAFRTTRLLNQLQPSFVPISAHSIVGIYRNYKQYDHTMYINKCIVDGECTEALPTNLKNYDSSSIPFKVFDSVFLLHNQFRNPNGNKREELWLYRLENPSLDSLEAIFEPILRLDSYLGDEVSYPSVALGESFVHIAYTYGRKHIRTALIPLSYFQKLEQGGGQKSAGSVKMQIESPQ